MTYLPKTSICLETSAPLKLDKGTDFSFPISSTKNKEKIKLVEKYIN